MGFSRDLSRCIDTSKEYGQTAEERSSQMEVALKSLLLEDFEVLAKEARFRVQVRVTRNDPVRVRWALKITLLETDYEYFIFIRKAKVRSVNDKDVVSGLGLSFEVGDEYIIKRENGKEVEVEVEAERNQGLDYEQLNMRTLKSEWTQVILKSEDNYFYDFYLANIGFKEFRLERERGVREERYFQNHFYLTFEKVKNGERMEWLLEGVKTETRSKE